jgi:hypothetical protein
MAPKRTSWAEFIKTSSGAVCRYASSPSADPLPVSAVKGLSGLRKINLPFFILFMVLYHLKV